MKRVVLALLLLLIAAPAVAQSPSWDGVYSFH